MAVGSELPGNDRPGAATVTDEFSVQCCQRDQRTAAERVGRFGAVEALDFEKALLTAVNDARGDGAGLNPYFPGNLPSAKIGAFPSAARS